MRLSETVELVWPGKGASESPQSEPPRLRAVERYGTSDGWRDRLILGDNLAVLRALRDGPLRAEIAAAGGLRLVYLDPPFLTGGRFAAEVAIGEAPPGGRARTVQIPAYDDDPEGGLAGYLDGMRTRLRLIHDLLADDGSLYLHVDHRLSAHLRLLLDEVFGAERFVNEIVWHYGLGNPGGSRAFARKHDTILLYGKTAHYRFNRLRGEVTPAMAAKYRHEDESGRYLVSYGRKYYLQGGKPFDSVWEIPSISATDAERLGYPTQKPEALLERIILASSDPGDLVADFCCGAGTLPAVAARLGRRWFACDSSPLAIQTVRKRLLLSAMAGFDRLQIDGFEPPAPVAYMATVAAAAATVAGQIRVSLAGFVPTAMAEPDPDRRNVLHIVDGQLMRLRRTPDGTVAEPLTRDWSEWIDSWAVEIAPAPAAAAGPFVPVWWTARSGRDRRLALSTPPLPRCLTGPARATVRVTDVLGGETAVVVPIAES